MLGCLRPLKFHQFLPPDSEKDPFPELGGGRGWLPATLSSCFNLTCSCTLIRLRLNEETSRRDEQSETRPDQSLFLPVSTSRQTSSFLSSLFSIPRVNGFTKVSRIFLQRWKIMENNVSPFSVW